MQRGLQRDQVPMNVTLPQESNSSHCKWPSSISRWRSHLCIDIDICVCSVYADGNTNTSTPTQTLESTHACTNACTGIITQTRGRLSSEHIMRAPTNTHVHEYKIARIIMLAGSHANTRLNHYHSLSPSSYSTKNRYRAPRCVHEHRC